MLIQANWKPLTEHSLRETEKRIQQTLRMDYETFINASFFLQGKADLFTQQRPGDRKRILGSILGLEVWEEYRQRASDRRKTIEGDISRLDGQLREIIAELSEEDVRRSTLKELQDKLDRLKIERTNQQDLVDNVRKIMATLREQEKVVETHRRQYETSNRLLEETRIRLSKRIAERDSYTEIVSRGEKIETSYTDWQEKRAELEHMEQIAEQFREQEKQREELRAEIQSERARLEQEAKTLHEQSKTVEAAREEIDRLRIEIDSAQSGLTMVEARLEQKAQLDSQLQEARQQKEEAKAENPRLRAEMEELKERIDRLKVTEGAECPLCGQLLGTEDRLGLIDHLMIQGKEMGDRYRSNSILLQQAEDRVKELEKEMAELAGVETDRLAHTQTLAQLVSQKEALEASQKEWEAKGAFRLREIEILFDNGTYAEEAHSRLAEIDKQLKKIGYDAAAHDALRKREQEERSCEDEMRALEKARATLAPLKREIDDLNKDITGHEKETDQRQKEHQEAAIALAAAQAQVPDLDQLERSLFNLQEQENRLTLEVGAARQKVIVLEELKTRRKALEAQREEWAMQVRQYKQLERAFSKDGVPALLIEQALPEIESKSNEILGRLSRGEMSVRFITQASYKDKSREDLRETLDIRISDSMGVRDYEMFSGGEAFRVNFAIRLALSEVLAQRAGARLQTLVIDEGFGSQDAQGRQRLIEAINLVRSDFAKILVITHIEELKEAFPTRIEVEKTDRGSMVEVVEVGF
jgi:exonuclease SbcC